MGVRLLGHRPPPKPDGRRQRRNARPQFALVSGTSGLEIPPAPDDLLPSTQESWVAYWTDEVARAARPSHMPVITRLFQRYDERERAYRTVKKDGRVTMGSQGQIVAHPLLKYIDACDAEIRQLEDRLGLSPRGMAQLGANFAAAQKSLDDLNDQLNHTDADGHSDDPRLSIAR